MFVLIYLKPKNRMVSVGLLSGIGEGTLRQPQQPKAEHYTLRFDLSLWIWMTSGLFLRPRLCLYFNTHK